MIQYDKNGIITQTLTEILDERENNLKPIMGEDFKIDSTSPIGNMELADSNSELAIQELIAYLIPNMIDANTAEGIFLDAICEKNRIYRKQPQYTTLNLIIKGITNTSFQINDITVQDSLSDIYYNLNEVCTIGQDGSVKAQFICQDYGAYSPLSTSEFKILTPMSGLNSVELDYENANISLGRLTETDEELRERRMYSVQQASTNTLASIKAVIHSIDGVNDVTYFENDTESEDENGLPMKSFEYVVDGGDENEISDAIFINKTVGTRAFGTTKIKKYDSEGNVYEIGFTKAKQINVGMEIRVGVDQIQSDTWRQKILTSIESKFNSIQKIGSIVKDYNYYVVLTQFPEITDITSILFYNIEDEEPSKVPQLEIGKKEIGKININNIELITNKD